MEFDKELAAFARMKRDEAEAAQAEARMADSPMPDSPMADRVDIVEQFQLDEVWVHCQSRALPFLTRHVKNKMMLILLQ